MNTKNTPKVGDIFHRVEGQYIDDGSETYQGMDLDWQQWEAVKVTPCGAWLRCIEWPHKKMRFALIPGARWASATRAEALESLIARKRRQLAIVEHQKETAAETLQLARAALAAMKGGAA